MTPLDLPPDASAALVYADEPPDLPDDRFVEVRHGVGVSFDGSRYHARIHVDGPADNRRIYDRHETAAIASAAKTHLRECDVVFLRLGSHVRLRDVRSAAPVAAIERRLAAVARREGGTLVTWTDADRRPSDEACYDVVIR